MCAGSECACVVESRVGFVVAIGGRRWNVFAGRGINRMCVYNRVCPKVFVMRGCVTLGHVMRGYQYVMIEYVMRGMCHEDMS